METAGVRHYGSMTGVRYALGRISLAFKRLDAEQPGAYSVIETSDPPGAQVGVHRHPTWEETFIVCAGRYDFNVDGRPTVMTTGDVLFVPLGAAHGFRSVGPEVGRLVVISSPGGRFEAFIREVTQAGSASSQPVDLRAVGARHGVEFLG